MATKWYYKAGDQEQGPHTFRHLVDMVRDDELAAENLVRPDYLQEWQRADTIIGLFHMAQRDPATLPSIGESNLDDCVETTDIDNLTTAVISSEELGDQNEAEKPGWLKRLLSLRNSKIPPVPVNSHQDSNVDHLQPGTDGLTNELQEVVEGLESDHQLAPSAVTDLGSSEESNSDSSFIAGAYSEETWSSAIGAAVDRIDERAPKPEEIPEPKKSVPVIRLSAFDSPLLRKILKAVFLIVCASLSFYGILLKMGQGTFYFPLIGVCSPLMFLVYSTIAFLGMLALGSLLIFFSSAYLRLGYKLGAVLFTTVSTALYLIKYEEDNFVIFPTQSTEPVAAKLIFPLVGECSSLTYWMYFIDVIVFVAVLTFFVAWWLEAQADDV